MDQLLPVTEVASRLGLQKSTIYKMVCQRRLAFIKPGGPHGRVLFRPEDIEAFILAHRVPSYGERTPLNAGGRG